MPYVEPVTPSLAVEHATMLRHYSMEWWPTQATNWPTRELIFRALREEWMQRECVTPRLLAIEQLLRETRDMTRTEIAERLLTDAKWILRQQLPGTDS